jgi:hypothetical protein
MPSTRKHHVELNSKTAIIALPSIHTLALTHTVKGGRASLIRSKERVLPLIRSKEGVLPVLPLLPLLFLLPFLSYPIY